MSVIPATPKTLLDQLSRRGELDEIKWQEFDRLYRPVVGFFLRQKFHSLISDYEDITQETMVKLVALLRGRKFDCERAKFRTYLYAIVYNLAVDWLRERKRQENLSFEEVEWMAPERTSALEMMERQWWESCYEAARKHVLERVPLADGYREIYREIESGEKASEIAAKLGVSPDLVRQVKHRVGEMIAAHLKLILSQNGESSVYTSKPNKERKTNEETHVPHWRCCCGGIAAGG